MSGRPAVPAVEIAARSDPGRDPDKQINEDACAHLETKHGYLAVVCDGMGGHAGGKEAAELAVRTICEVVQGAPEPTKPADALRVAIEEANRRVWAMPISESGLRPGSTVVAVLAHHGGVEIAHVGDSRVYLIHGGAISQITKDHSMVQELVERNLIRAEDAASHPDANKIMRALGIAREVEVELRPEPVVFVAGDVFVLGSDGLSDLVTASEILQHAEHPPAQAAGQLVDLANARGGHDNVTAMVVRMKTSAAATDAPTIVKTVQDALRPRRGMTQALEEREGGPRGTVLAEPAPGAAAQVPVAPVPVAIPPAPPPPPPSGRDAERRPLALIVAGLALAVISLALVGLYLWSESRPKHVAPLIVESGAPPLPATASELDAAPPEVPPSPPLSASGVPALPTASATTVPPSPTPAPTPRR